MKTLQTIGTWPNLKGEEANNLRRLAKILDDMLVAKDKDDFILIEVTPTFMILAGSSAVKSRYDELEMIANQKTKDQ